MSQDEEREAKRDDVIVGRRIDRRAFLGLTAASGAALFLVACGDDGDSSSSASSAATSAEAPAESSAAAVATSAEAEVSSAEAEVSSAEPGASSAVESVASDASSAAATGDTPATRAIAGIKALGLPADFTITVFSEDLSILGPEVTKDKFEAESGIKLDLQRAPYLEYAGKVLNDATTKAGTFDVVLMETNRMGDLDNAGYLTDVGAWVEKYDPDLEDMVAPIGRVSSLYNGKYVGIPDDGDVFIFYYRKDLLDGPGGAGGVLGEVQP